MSAETAAPLTRRDVLQLTLFCGLLFGVAVISNRPLSVHESVLPQSARQMYADGDWIVPHKGHAPWLESPPLPQWITVSLATLCGRCDVLWVVRLGPVLMATLTVLLLSWMASVWFGRTIGLLSGFILATCAQFTRYAWLAEDEIFLCTMVTAAVAVFVKLEFQSDWHAARGAGGPLRSFFGKRSTTMLLFFVLLGMTNLVKGLLFGTVMALVPIALFLLWNRDPSRIGRYFWFWGWLAFAAVAAAWPLAAWTRFPDVLDLWVYDLGGRFDGSYTSKVEPWWYYPVNLLWMLAPWTLVIPFGIVQTRIRAQLERYSAERFVWCWAFGVPLVFSLSAGKHHHYMLHALAPWAVFAAFGLLRVRSWFGTWPYRLRNPWNSLVTTALPLLIALWVFGDRIPGPPWIDKALMAVTPVLTVFLSWALFHANTRLAGVTLFVVIAGFYGLGHVVAGNYVDRHRQDAAFLQEVRDLETDEVPILVDMDVEPLAGFLHLFYLDDHVVPLHNLTFLASESVPQTEVLVLTRSDKAASLNEYGQSAVILRGWKTDRKNRPVDQQLILCRLNFHDSLNRVATDSVRVSPMQAMGRVPGPYLRK